MITSVDINPSTVIKLSDRGSFQTVGIVTDVEPFLRALESGLVRLAKVVIAIILRKWPRSMWERLLEPEERFTLTPEGEELYEFAYPFFSKLGEMSGRLRGEESQHLKLAASAAVLTKHCRICWRRCVESFRNSS